MLTNYVGLDLYTHKIAIHITINIDNSNEIASANVFAS